MRDDPFDGPILVTIQYGLNTIRFTNWETSITIDGETWVPAAGCEISQMGFAGDGTPSNADILVDAVEGGILEPGDAASGKLDNWPITVECPIDAADFSAGTVTLIDGTVGSVEEDSDGIVTIAANGPLRFAAMKSLTEHYSLTGREELGDDRCKIPILGDPDIDAFDIGRAQEFVRPDVETGLQHVADAYGRVRTGSTVEDYGNVYFECTVAGTTDESTAPAYNYTVGATTVDGTATFIARNSWLRYARGEATDAFTIALDALPDVRATDTGWYELGGVFVRSGNLSGYKELPIRLWDPDSLTITLALPINPDDIPADTQLELRPGCDYTPGRCAEFANPANPSGTNIENIRAEYFVPPPDMQLSLVNIAQDSEIENLKQRIITLEGA